MDATAKQVAGVVGPRIRRIRRGLDMSQEALADNAEIHRTQMTKFEWGERLPRLDTLVKLAGGLGVGLEPCLKAVRHADGLRRVLVAVGHAWVSWSAIRQAWIHATPATSWP